MANDSTRVLVGRPNATGGVYSGPLGTTLPTDATTALDAALVAKGLVSEDGLQASYERSSNDIKDWGGNTVRSVQTDVTDSYTFALIQSDAEVLKEVFGDAQVTVTPADATHGEQISIAANGEPLPAKVYVFEMKDGLNKHRIVVPNGQITATDQITYTNGDAISYSLTLTAYPDSSGNTHYDYWDDGVVAAG